AFHREADLLVGLRPVDDLGVRVVRAQAAGAGSQTAAAAAVLVARTVRRDSAVQAGGGGRVAVDVLHDVGLADGRPGSRAGARSAAQRPEGGPVAGRVGHVRLLD